MAGLVSIPRWSEGGAAGKRVRDRRRSCERWRDVVVCSDLGQVDDREDGLEVERWRVGGPPVVVVARDIGAALAARRWGGGGVGQAQRRGAGRVSVPGLG